MNVSYKYDITVMMELSDEQFDLLTEAMKNHSDCEGATRVGEFWYGNMNRRRWKDDPLPNQEPTLYYATTRQLDTKVIKSLEPYVNYDMGDKEKQAKGVALYYELMKVLKDAIEHHNLLAGVSAKLKEVIHFYDSSQGLWCTDRKLEDLLTDYWQSSSDACPLEATEAEAQEIGFREFVKKLQFQL